MVCSPMPCPLPFYALARGHDYHVPPLGSFPSSLPRNGLAMAVGVVMPCPFPSDAAQSAPIPHCLPASLTIPTRVSRADSLFFRRTRLFGQDNQQDLMAVP